MKKCFLSLAVVSIVAVISFLNASVAAQDDSGLAAASPHLVISQFQTGGDGPGTFNDEFVEIHNTSSNPIDLNGFRVVYRSATGSNDVAVPFAVWTSPTILAPGGYYLIASNSYNGSTPANLTYNTSSCSCSMGGAGGGLAIRSGLNDTGAIIDSVGYGTATNIFVEGAAAAAPAANSSQSRKESACQDTDNNASDFSITNPSAPRNTSSPVVVCSGGETTLFAAMNANPPTINAGGTTLLTVSVVPAALPPSTGITVVGALGNIGGSSNQQFFDNGTNGDVTPGDNVFSYQITVSGAGGGQHSVSAIASDLEGRTANASTILTVVVNGCPVGDQPLALGNPTNAITNILDENNYLMVKPQYTLSYNRSRAISNWTAWRLDSSWIGTAPRQDDYRPDPALPAGWYQVMDNDYSGSGFDRGHLAPSGDRTCSVATNSATFLMTNLMPQAANNNQGPWEELETYSRALAAQGNELYIFAGGHGQGGTGVNGPATTISNGRIVVPAYTWKVIVVLPVGTNDADRVTKTTRTIAVIMPNQQSIGISTPWRNFRTSIKTVEAMTGFNFLTNVRPIVRNVMKQRRDTL